MEFGWLHKFYNVLAPPFLASFSFEGSYRVHFGHRIVNELRSMKKNKRDHVQAWSQIYTPSRLEYKFTQSVQASGAWFSNWFSSFII